MHASAVPGRPAQPGRAHQWDVGQTPKSAREHKLAFSFPAFYLELEPPATKFNRPRGLVKVIGIIVVAVDTPGQPLNMK